MTGDCANWWQLLAAAGLLAAGALALAAVAPIASHSVIFTMGQGALVRMALTSAHEHPVSDSHLHARAPARGLSLDAAPAPGARPHRGRQEQPRDRRRARCLPPGREVACLGDP